MATLSQDVKGSMEEPLNNSKSSGGVMRSAPIGLMYYKNPNIAFDIGAKCAALTHGHPDGYLSAGTYAAIIANIVSGKNKTQPQPDSISILRTKENSNDLVDMLEKAISYSKQDDLTPTDAIKNLGQGWYGDEALAIAIYCNLKTPNDYKQVLINAVNHDGDSDTVGSIAGGISGAYVGYNNIPDEFKGKIKLGSVYTRFVI